MNSAGEVEETVQQNGNPIMQLLIHQPGAVTMIDRRRSDDIFLLSLALYDALSRNNNFR